MPRVEFLRISGEELKNAQEYQGGLFVKDPIKEYEKVIRKFLGERGIKPKRDLFFLQDDPLFPTEKNLDRTFSVNLYENAKPLLAEQIPKLNSVYELVFCKKPDIKRLSLFSDRIEIENNQGEMTFMIYGQTFYYVEYDESKRGFGKISDSAFKELPDFATLITTREGIHFQAEG